MPGVGDHFLDGDDEPDPDVDGTPCVIMEGTGVTPMGLQRYFPQAPGREWSFEAEVTAPAGLLAPTPLLRIPAQVTPDSVIGH